MLLAVSVGNTNIALGVSDGAEILCAGRIPLGSPLLQEVWNTAEWGPFRTRILQIAVAGVNAPRQQEFATWAAGFFGRVPQVARRDFDIPLRNRCVPPDEVGTDRLLNAYAAHRLYEEDAVVVDFGTAMSFSVVSSGGEFLGGAIAPGLRMAARSLHEQTQALPLVSPQPVCAATGVSTEHAINAGLCWGVSGMLDRILETLLAERPGGARILGTGGDLDWFLRLTRCPIEAHPNLTLQGLMFAFTHFQEGKR